MSDTRQRAMQLIVAERHRQVTKENWSEAHDDSHTDGCLATAGAAYAMAAASHASIPESTKLALREKAKVLFPFDADDWWKPSDPVRDLAKAGALIMAELERVLRAEVAPPPEGHFRCTRCKEICPDARLRLLYNFGGGLTQYCTKCISVGEAKEAAEAVDQAIGPE